MFVLRYLDEDVGSCVYTERNVCLIGLLASMAYPINLVLSFPEGAVLWEAVFQVATNRTGLNGQSDCFSHFLGRVSITALQIHRHRQVHRFRDPPKIVDREGERRVFTVRVTTRLRNGPAAGSDSLGTSRIPDVKQHERFARNVKMSKPLGLLHLSCHVFS